jgi:hypothetical protein
MSDVLSRPRVINNEIDPRIDRGALRDIFVETRDLTGAFIALASFTAPELRSLTIQPAAGMLFCTGRLINFYVDHT